MSENKSKRYEIDDFVLRSHNGFTLIELLVVIAIIGILSTVAMTSLNGARAKARDSKRLSNMEQIRLALELYKADNGNYPIHTSSNGDWEFSYEDSAEFLEILETDGYMPDGVPVDPLNSASKYYGYYRYNAGGSGCSVAGGDYYVLVISDMETGVRPYAKSPGWDCPLRHNWVTSYDWVAGEFQK